MKRLAFDYKTTLIFSEPVSRHAFLLRCIPPSFCSQQILSVTLSLWPCVPYSLEKDGFGNLLQTGYIAEPHDRFSYAVQGTAVIDPSLRAQEALHPMYRFPSACTRPNKALLDFASGLRLTGGAAQKAMQIAGAVHAALAYTPGATNVETTAAEAFDLKEGVCQDYTHIFLCLARLRGIPARYVNGLPEGEGASHAWAEIYDRGQWVGIDPTRNRPVCDSYIRLCVGRDFNDCSIERGVFLGVTAQTQTVRVHVAEQ